MKNKNTNEHYYEVGSLVTLDGGSEPYTVISNNPRGMIQGVVVARVHDAKMAIAISTKRLTPVV
jgi:hypothetical protein